MTAGLGLRDPFATDRMSATLAGRLRAKYTSQSHYSPGNSEEDKDRQLFRGFIGGAAFITKKGYRGLAIETSWAKNILSSFDEDDVELAMHALKSSLANLNETVEGGIAGAPFSIGEYGFFSEAQFEAQTQLICAADRENANRRKIFFSENEWKQVDEKLATVAHYATKSFPKVVRGDNVGILALRRDAFSVATLFLHRGVDPLRENEDGQDMFGVTKEQYMSLTIRLKQIVPRQEEYLSGPRIRSAMEAINSDSTYLADRFLALKEFTIELQKALALRANAIESDINFRRRCELLHEPCPIEKLWNIEQLPKLLKHNEEIGTILDFAQQKSDHARRLIDEFQTRIRTKTAEMNETESSALIASPMLKFLSPQLSNRLGISGTSSNTSSNSNLFRTPEKGLSGRVGSGVKLPLISTPGSNTPVKGSSTNNSALKANNYTPILGAISYGEHEITLYR